MGYAKQRGIGVGGVIAVAGRKYPVVGLVDASKAAKIAQCQRVSASGRGPTPGAGLAAGPVRVALAPGDVNLLFLSADQKRIPGMAATLKGILGDKASVSTPESFLKQLGNLFAFPTPSPLPCRPSPSPRRRSWC